MDTDTVPVAVVTGGTGGLGMEVVKRLLARRYLVAVPYLVPAEATGLEEALRAPEDELMLRRVDITENDAADGFLDEVVSAWGRVDVLCCLVGGWAGGRDIEETDEVRFDRMIDLNLRSTFSTMRAAIPHMKRAGGGRIVAVGSKAAYDTPPGQAAYNVAKAGVIALAQTAAQELADSHIAVNAVLPSAIDTPALRKAMPYAEYVDWPKPEEIAAVIEFLACGDSHVINGAAIPVYGRA